MSKITKWMVAPVFVLGIALFAFPSEARAQYGAFRGSGLQITIGGGGYQNYRSPYQSQYRSNYGGYSNNGYGGGYQSYRVQPYGGNFGHGGHYGGGHYDYHPTEVYRHGNHYDVQPGHYDYHQGSHFGHHGH